MSGFNDFGNFAGKILADTRKLRQVAPAASSPAFPAPRKAASSCRLQKRKPKRWSRSCVMAAASSWPAAIAAVATR